MKSHPTPASGPARGLLASLAAFIVLTQTCPAPPYIKFDGIDGSLALTSVHSSLRAASAGMPATSSLQFTKAPDKASPFLLQACGSGEVIKRVTIGWQDAAGTVFRITLGDLTVSSFKMATDQSVPPQPVEECELRFQSVEWSYFGPDGAQNTTGGEGLHLDLPAQLATGKTYQPFTASLTQVAGQRMLRLTCPVERGRTYRISASSTLDGQWLKLADFTAIEDGQMEQMLAESAGRLFLRVEALD